MSKLNGAHRHDDNVVKFPGRKPQPSDGNRGTRALFTFLLSTLIGPAIAAALLALTYAVAGLFNMGPPSLKAVKMAELPVYIATRTLDAYVWSAVPAALTGAVLAAVIWKQGQFPWLLGVAVAAFAASAWAFATGGQAMNHVQFIGVIAGITAILGRLVLTVVKLAD